MRQASPDTRRDAKLAGAQDVRWTLGRSLGRLQLVPRKDSP
jgi:hypothetical protein